MTSSDKKNLRTVVDLRRRSEDTSNMHRVEVNRKKLTRQPLILKRTNPFGTLLSRRSGRTQRRVQKVAPPKKKMRLKERRAYKRRVILYGGVSLAVLGMVGLSLLTWNEKLAIRTVIITGNTTISSKLLEAVTLKSFSDARGSFVSGKTIVTASLSTAEQTLLDEFPKLKSAKLHRAGIDAVKLVVVEKQPAFAWCGSLVDALHKCYIADATGFIYEPMHTNTLDDIPHVYGGLNETEPLRHQVLGGAVGPLVQILTALHDNHFTPITVLISIDAIDARVHTREGVDFIFLIKDDPKKAIAYLSTLTNAPEFIAQKNRIEYVDMRVGNRIFYKLRTSEGSETPVAQ